MTKYDNAKLKAVIKILKENKARVRVGILGENNSRSKDSFNNATLGLWHEFGTFTMVPRSFLRMPMTTEFKKNAENAKGFYGKNLWLNIYETRSMIPLLKKLGIIAEKTIDDAFQTGGFGQWPDLHAETWLRKKNLQILVETGQLRRSITSEVVE